MPEPMTRAEHLRWCQDRALAYLQPTQPVTTEAAGPRGRRYHYADGTVSDAPEQPAGERQVADALASLLSDLGKHPATASHPAILLSGLELLGGGLRTAAQVRHFIEGCN